MLCLDDRLLVDVGFGLGLVHWVLSFGEGCDRDLLCLVVRLRLVLGLKV